MLLTTFFSVTTLFTLFLLLHVPRLSATSHRRFLHHPFFPLPPSPSQPPSLPPSSPPSLPKHSPSTISDFSGNTNPNNYPFFPTFPTTPPPPPPPSTTALPTFPANISSLALPSTSSPPSHSPLSPKLIITLVLLSLLTLSLIISLSLLLRRRHHHHRNNNLHYSPSQKPLSPPPPPSKPSHNLSHTSSDLLYVTNSLTVSRDFQPTTSSTTAIEPPQPSHSSTSEFYLKLCGDDSPELRPLPPLPKTTTTTSSQHHHVTFDNNIQIHFKDDEDFYSPTSLDNENNSHFDNFGLNLSPTRSYSDFPASDSDVSVEIQTLAAKTHHFPAGGRVGPPPAAPPPPPPPGMGPPPLVPPSGPVVFKSSGNLGEKRKSGEGKEESNSSVTMKPKLKALHWDKVRASSDRVMVWDHLQPASFQ